MKIQRVKLQTAAKSNIAYNFSLVVLKEAKAAMSSIVNQALSELNPDSPFSRGIDTHDIASLDRWKTGQMLIGNSV